MNRSNSTILIQKGVKRQKQNMSDFTIYTTGQQCNGDINNPLFRYILVPLDLQKKVFPHLRN
eukprot:UN03921